MPTSAPDQTRIVNAALAELGAIEQVTSIDAVSNHAHRAKALWPDVLREALSLHPWNFALKRAMLNESAVPAAFGYRRRFAIPADCIRWLPPGEGTREWYRGEREGETILADAEAPLPFRYIAEVDDPARWPPPFARLMIFSLAASMAEGITQSAAIKDRLLKRADNALRKAKRMDGLETGATQRGAAVAHSDWLRARNGTVLPYQYRRERY